MGLCDKIKPNRPLVFYIQGTVILHIWWQVLLMFFYTIGVVLLQNYLNFLTFTTCLPIVSILGIVIGVLLVFRTNTANKRFWQGRSSWSFMVTQIRNMTRLIWVGVDDPPTDDPQNSESTKVRNFVEKTTAINLLMALPFATKNYLREEYSYEEEDLDPLIRHLPHFRRLLQNQEIGKMDNSLAKSLSRLSVHHKNSESRRRSNKIDGKNVEKDGSSWRPKQSNVLSHANACPTNIPLEISYYIFAYVNHVVGLGLVDGSTTFYMFDAMIKLLDILTTLEKILRTPIPLAYAVHLHQAVWVFLLALPFQLVSSLQWWTIPAVTLASFAFLGILWIGIEIENPFGYDDNDLPLDDYCKVLKEELQIIKRNPMPPIDSWIFSPKNVPMAPNSSLNAEELTKLPLSELERILAKGAELRTNPGVSTSNLDNTAYVQETP